MMSIPVIKLTEKEVALFDILLQSLKHSGKSTTLRVAGGWVRDKLLGRYSDDIDVALDDQSGVEFANGVKAYLESLGETVGNVAVVMVRML